MACSSSSRRKTLEQTPRQLAMTFHSISDAAIKRPLWTDREPLVRKAFWANRSPNAGCPRRCDPDRNYFRNNFVRHVGAAKHGSSYP
jgi:hypothetical protein